MNSMQQVFFMILETLGSLYVGVCVLRVLLQAARADYYNPVSQFVVKATALPVSLLRRVIPSLGRLDGGALVWALLVQLLIIELLALLAGGLVAPLTALTWGAIGLANLTLTLYYYGLFIVIIVSFLVVLGGLNISHPAFDLINQLMRPVMQPFSRILPPMGGIDLSPILMFLAIRVLQVLIGNLAYSAGLTNFMAAIVPGI